MEYETYKPPISLLFIRSAEYLLFCCLLGKLFYGFWPVGGIGIFLLPVFLKQQKEELIRKRRQKLLLQFQDLIRSYGTALKAGYSVENAFREAFGDLAYLYEKDDLIMVECELIETRMKNGHSLDELLSELGKRSGLADISDFASVFAVAKKSGGNLAAMIADCSQKISDKLSVTEEIRLMFAAKALEQKVMNLVPVGIMLYISLGNPDYFTPLYGNAAGIAIMTAALVLYGTAFLLAKKITDIRI